jgi:hypothetical protein
VKRFLELLKSRAPHALALAGALVAAEFLRVEQIVSGSSGQPYFAAAVEQFSNWFLTSLVIVTVISACEAAMAPGGRRAMAQAALLASSTVLYAYFVGTSPLLTIQYNALGMDTGPGLFMYTAWLGWAMSALLSWYYWAHEKSTRAFAALRHAEIARERTQQRLLESRLQILEAQVEPRFLLETLSRVQHLYERDPSGADRVLDDLIDYLRAALPQLRERASTLGRELDLIGAYLRIVSAASSRIPRLDGGLERAYAPPMVLLPIVQLALAAGGTGPKKAQPLAIRIDEAEGRIALHVDFEAERDWNPASEAQSLRATLFLLFGAEGRLAISTAGARAAVSVSWPMLPAVPEVPLQSITA